MRVNIYAEELGKQVVNVQRNVDVKLFYGSRIFLASPPELHNTEGDDDRPAVTFWFDRKERRDQFSNAVNGVLIQFDCIAFDIHGNPKP